MYQSTTPPTTKSAKIHPFFPALGRMKSATSTRIAGRMYGAMMPTMASPTLQPMSKGSQAVYFTIPSGSGGSHGHPPPPPPPPPPPVATTEMPIV